MQEKPLILISNDDGVHAKGINQLIQVLRPIGELVVMAPDSPRSGASAAITSQESVSFSLVSEGNGVHIYQCTGTPTDCVKLALETVVPRKPDLVIGGINHGDNSAVNVHYSGTMGVVLEGCMKGISSIGFSLCDHDPDADFSAALPFIVHITRQVLEHGLPSGVCLNVNFPQKPPYRGIKVCRQTEGVWEHEWCHCLHPRSGEKLYWITGHFKNNEPHRQDNDKWALDNGFVAITPTQIDMTAYAMISQMNKEWNLVL